VKKVFVFWKDAYHLNLNSINKYEYNKFDGHVKSQAANFRPPGSGHDALAG
jgi:hypothetical protein